MTQTEMDDLADKLWKLVAKDEKYRQLVESGYQPKFEISDDMTKVIVSTAECKNGHPKFIITGLCLVHDCEGSE